MAVPKLTKEQWRAYVALSFTEPRSAYGLAKPSISLTTLQALVRKGAARDVTKPGPGGMFSPRTHYHFIKVPL